MASHTANGPTSLLRRARTTAVLLGIMVTATALPVPADEVRPFNDLSKESPAQLILRLPTNTLSIPPDAALIQALIKSGNQAVPLLEKELRLGISFRELNQILQKGESRRYAVACVLAHLPGPRSTELLVRALADTPDNLAMQYTILQALEKRSLLPAHITKMLASDEPAIVLAGLVHAARHMKVPKIRTAVGRIFDHAKAKAQFHNEYGAATANRDELWELRLAAGKLLQTDMAPEMQARAAEILLQLKQEALRPTNPGTSVFMSYASQAESTIIACLSKLVELGQSVNNLIMAEAEVATGDYATILDMALLRLGDRSKIARVNKQLTSSPSHTIRFCAAVTLRIVKDRSSIPALQAALRDPYHRQDGSCLGQGEIYPVRKVAADALINYGGL